MLSHDEVGRLIQDIWSTTLDLSLEQESEAEPWNGQKRLTGAIYITGSWNGVVTVDCSKSLAQEASARLFDTTAEEADLEDVCDTLSELTNICGGNVKALVSERSNGVCQLSLPSVTEGREYAVAIPRAERVVELDFNYQGEKVKVSVFRKTEAA